MRPGIVHRLDRGTSGALVVARNDAAHRALAAQFRARTVQKTYIALLHGRLQRDSGVIALPIARDPKRRTRMTARLRSGREASTGWRVLLRLEQFHAGRGRSAHRPHAPDSRALRRHRPSARRRYALRRRRSARARAASCCRRLAASFCTPRGWPSPRRATAALVEVRAPLDPALKAYLDELAAAVTGRTATS